MSRDATVEAHLRAVLRQLPLAPGVYLMKGAGGRVLYVGKARSLRSRVAAYTQPTRLDNRLIRMVSGTRTMEFAVTGSVITGLSGSSVRIVSVHCLGCLRLARGLLGFLFDSLVFGPAYSYFSSLSFSKSRRRTFEGEMLRVQSLSSSIWLEAFFSVPSGVV